MKINEAIVDELKSLCNLASFGPGALLYNFNVEGRQEQINFLTNVLQTVNPKHALETGTESGLFCYFIKEVLPDVQIVTFGLDGTDDNRGRKCTDHLNKVFGQYINFIHGDSRETLTNYTTNTPIEFAWIDGGHDVSILTSDLENCSRLKIPHICVDDYYMIHDIIQPCIDLFLEKHPEYKLHSISDKCDDRGIVYLTLR